MGLGMAAEVHTFGGGEKGIFQDLLHKLPNVGLLGCSCFGDVEDLDLVLADEPENVCCQLVAHDWGQSFAVFSRSKASALAIAN